VSLFRSATPVRSPEIAIIGAGISGLCMAVALKRAGIHSFTIYDKNEGLGGTWRDNEYPGAACDIPSHLYSFSFDPNPDFSRKYSAQTEIRRYLEGVAERHQLLPHFRFGKEATRARFDDKAHTWRLAFRDGTEVTTDVVITGTGQLNLPIIPDFPGLESFDGKKMHSARFDPRYDVTGRRVAVIGSGASAVQIVPQVAARAAHLSVFQRSAHWVMPRNDRGYAALERWAFRKMPQLLEAYRSLLYVKHEVWFLPLANVGIAQRIATTLAERHLETQIPDPALRQRLTPDFPIGCKRILISDDYYPAFNRPNVDLVTDRIQQFEPAGIRDASGKLHEVGTVIFATGFDSTAFLAPMEIRGRYGTRLEDAWKGGAEAYLGMSVSGFPNLFLLYGPNTNLGHNSIIFMIECQVNYVVQCIERMREKRLSTFEVRHDAMTRYNQGLDEDLAKTIWSAGCDSWYKNEAGKITNNWSSFTTAYWWRTRRPKWSAFAEERA
jgi:cation diffusion facilitator CzcD-associated flavoprotein CzcO